MQDLLCSVVLATAKQGIKHQVTYDCCQMDFPTGDNKAVLCITADYDLFDNAAAAEVMLL